jgi:Terminase small subunit
VTCRRSGRLDSASSAQQNAHGLSENEGVKARIAELRARNAEKCQLSRDEAVQYLVEILKTPIAEVTADYRLAQSYDAKGGKIEVPNKLSAMQLLAKMCGWNEPEKHEFDHGYKAQQNLVEVIARLRGRGAVRNNQCAG